jgi:hypothetical protein
MKQIRLQQVGMGIDCWAFTGRSQGAVRGFAPHVIPAPIRPLAAARRRAISHMHSVLPPLFECTNRRANVPVSTFSPFAPIGMPVTQKKPAAITGGWRTSASEMARSRDKVTKILVLIRYDVLAVCSTFCFLMIPSEDANAEKQYNCQSIVMIVFHFNFEAF